MDFFYLIRVLLKRKWIIIIAGVLAASFAYFFTRNEKKYYKSRAQISTGFTVSDEIKVNDANFSFFEADTKFNNAIVTCTSPTVINLLSYSLILHDLEDQRPFRHLTSQQQESAVYKQVNKAKAEEVITDKLETMRMLNSYDPQEKLLLEFLKLYEYDYKSISKNINVYRLERTDYIEIDFMSDNPELSAYVVNTLFQQFLRYYKSVRSSKSQESIDTLKSLMDKRKQELDAKNTLLRNEGLIDVAQQNGSKLDLIAELEKNLSDEKGKQIDLYSSLQKVNQKISNLGKITVANKEDGTENDELLILRKQMNDAYKEYLNSGSTDKTLLSKYNNLKSQYQTKYANLNSSPTSDKGKEKEKQLDDLLNQKSDIDIDIQASTKNIAAIQSQINSLKGNVAVDASKGATVETLLKEVDLANKDYLDAKQKYNEALDMSTSSVNNFRQILYGQPAIDPEPSKRKLIIGMAGISAILTTMLVIIVLAYLDSSIKTPVIFSKTVNLKLISMINFMNLKNRSLEEIITNVEDKEGDNRHNIFRESLRKLRYEIESSGKKIFLFTSTKKGQGKTTLIQALSYSMSLSKKKILIIDTNFCNNDLTVQLDAVPILEKIHPDDIRGNSLVEEVKNMSKKVSEGTVFVIGSEGGDYTPSEILPKENLLQHLRELNSEYDYIFLEGPPLNDFSDSKELTQYVDGVIGVFSANEIIKQIDKESIKFYKTLDDKFCGAILNMVDLTNVNVI